VTAEETLEEDVEAWYARTNDTNVSFNLAGYQGVQRVPRSIGVWLCGSDQID
jgi:hypothetical protein